MQSFKEFVQNVIPAALTAMRPEQGPRQIQPVMMVNASQLDVRVPDREVIPQAIKNMERAVSQILQDEEATVKAADDDGGEVTSWGRLFGLSPSEHTNYVQIEYRPQIGRNTLGNAAWSAGYWARNPGKASLQKLGLATDPEKYYLSKFRDELNRMANQGILNGWPEDWDITTSALGRNIILKPKVHTIQPVV